MEEEYLEQYIRIMGKDNWPPRYSTPEEQGKQFRKFSILEPVEEIKYSDRSVVLEDD